MLSHCAESTAVKPEIDMKDAKLKDASPASQKEIPEIAL